MLLGLNKYVSKYHIIVRPSVLEKWITRIVIIVASKDVSETFHFSYTGSRYSSPGLSNMYPVIPESHMGCGYKNLDSGSLNTTLVPSRTNGLGHMTFCTGTCLLLLLVYNLKCTARTGASDVVLLLLITVRAINSTFSGLLLVPT